ncbi:MAG: hypothetical protein D6729_16355 [Deltaproteobacteria bacterium]|nr:MAG: hypothetical protein D6729_16355 [Deltaproteobacteria bacterium]
MGRSQAAAKAPLSPLERLRRARALRSAGRCEDALVLLDALIEARGHRYRAEAYLERGRCHRALGDLEAAKNDFALAASLARSEETAQQARAALEGL